MVLVKCSVSYELRHIQIDEKDYYQVGSGKTKCMIAAGGGLHLVHVDVFRFIMHHPSLSSLKTGW